jgi:hypothetical protein
MGVVFMVCAQGAQAANVVSNAMKGATYANLAAAVAAAADGDQLVMIGDETLATTLLISNRVLSIVSDGAVRTIRGSTNCSYDMVMLVGTNATLTLGRPEGSDAAPTLIFDGGRNSGVSNLYDMVYSDQGWLTIHPGVVFRNLASVDKGAIYNNLGVVEMYGGRIENNSANYGGGILNVMGDVWIYGGSITGNVASLGGGIFNEAVVKAFGLIVGYLGEVEITGGLIAGNVATAAGGGIISWGKLDLAGGRVTGNSAPEGGGVLHVVGTTFGMTLGGTAVVAGNTAPQGSGIYYNNDGSTWLTVVDGGRVEPPNDVYMGTTNNPVVLSGALSGRGIAAQITPPAYTTNQAVLGTTGSGNSWIVSNYYGKFTVTPEAGGGAAWHVGANGRLTHVDPAGLEAEIGEVSLTESGVEMAILPAYVAWDGVLDFATNVVDRAWNFQPLPTNEYAVTNGHVVVAPDAPMGVFRMRRK